ncbi:MAG: IS630 family transposase, partial [Roseibacillus sp.]
EISALVRTGLTDRIETLDEFRQQLAAVVQRRNLSGAKTNWQFRSEDARVKLHSIYPSLQS